MVLAAAVLSPEGRVQAQALHAVPFTIGNQGTAGPATPASPLLASNHSFTDATWCQQFSCVLRGKAASNDGYRLPAGQQLIAYTYDTRLGSVKVWRLASTGQVLKVLVRPSTWNHQQISPLLRLVTGQAVPETVTARCATQTSTWKNLWSASMLVGSSSSGSRVTFNVNCELKGGAALTVIVPLAAVQAAAGPPRSAAVPASAPASSSPANRQRSFVMNWIGCREARYLDDLQLLAARNSGQASAFMDQMLDTGQCRLFRVGNRYAVLYAPVTGDYWQIESLDTGVRYWTIPEGLSGP